MHFLYESADRSETVASVTISFVRVSKHHGATRGPPDRQKPFARIEAKNLARANTSLVRAKILLCRSHLPSQAFRPRGCSPGALLRRRGIGNDDSTFATDAAGNSKEIQSRPCSRG